MPSLVERFSYTKVSRKQVIHSGPYYKRTVEIKETIEKDLGEDETQFYIRQILDPIVNCEYTLAPIRGTSNYAITVFGKNIEALSHLDSIENFTLVDQSYLYEGVGRVYIFEVEAKQVITNRTTEKHEVIPINRF